MTWWGGRIFYFSSSWHTALVHACSTAVRCSYSSWGGHAEKPGVHPTPHTVTAALPCSPGCTWRPRDYFCSWQFVQTSVLNSVSNRSLASHSVQFFVEFCHVFHLWHVCLRIWQPPCVCIYVLHRPATSPVLERVACCSRCPRGTPRVGCVHPSVVVGLWLLLAHCLEGLTLRLTDCEGWLWL